MTSNYYPEMNEKKPAAEIEIVSSYSGHQIIKTWLDLPKMRGLTFIRKYTPKMLVEFAQHKVGMNEYHATKKAFEAIEKKYSCSRECLL